MKRKISMFLTTVFIILITIGSYYGITHYFLDSSFDSIFSSGETGKINSEWNLMLVNAKHPIPKGYAISLMELSNGVLLDKRIYPDLQEMFGAARADGLSPIVVEGYRTHQAQEEMMKNTVNEYIELGYSHWKAKRMAKKYVAKPGTSEHELGLALDINATAKENEWKVYTWLADNAYRYGFILRYPEGKEKITGINYEPWHYRYVGKSTALEMYQQNITLEEYLKQ